MLFLNQSKIYLKILKYLCELGSCSDSTSDVNNKKCLKVGIISDCL